MTTLTVEPAAEQDITRAHDWYEGQRAQRPSALGLARRDLHRHRRCLGDHPVRPDDDDERSGGSALEFGLDLVFMDKPLRVADDIVAIGKFKSQAASWLRRINETGQRLVITQNGTAAGVLMAPGEFDRLRSRMRLLEDIAKGTADFEQGRSLTTSQVRRELAKARSARK
jgi:prevent-host-death family protein